MLITEAVLKELGFVQQQPPNIWDWGRRGDTHFRFINYGKKGKDEWYFILNGGESRVCKNLMTLVHTVAIDSYRRGVEETQQKFHEAMGFDRLLDKIMDRVNDYRREE